MTCTNEKCGRQYVGKSEEELRQRHYGHKKEIDLKSTMLGKHFAEKCGYGFFQIQASSGLSDTLESYHGILFLNAKNIKSLVDMVLIRQS